MSTEMSELKKALPAHLQGDNKETGLEGMSQYIIPPRLKVCQAKREDVYEQFEEGDVVVTPQLIRLCRMSEGFLFTPIFTFAEFCVHNPYPMRSSLPMIRERTLDASSEIARKAKAMTEEDCPENPKFKIKYVQHLNFIVVVHDMDVVHNIPILLSFHSGEYKYGSSALGLMQMRCSGGIPIYGCKFAAMEGEHKNPQFKWRGLNIMNPTADFDTSPWVEDGNAYASYKKLYDDMRSSKDRIIADYDDPVGHEPQTDTL